jgi:predicted nucleic acid-binding protein
VKVIVDANIVFSAILNSNGKIGDVLINSSHTFDFIAPEFLRKEIYRHYKRLCKISGLSEEQVREAEFQVCKHIRFMSEEQIKKSAWESAAILVEGVDPKDVQYVAFSRHFRCKIWSGDKSLIAGLKIKGFTQFITTDELFKRRKG